MDDFIKVARQTAEKAGAFLKKEVKKTQKVKEKGSSVNIVTGADIETQNLIVGIIKKSFPEHGILSEESEVEINVEDYEYLWVIDPIDGTSAFAAGFSTYSSSIALLQNKKPIVGAIYIALTNEVIWAVLGKGAYLQNKKLIISDNKELIESTIGFDPGYPPRERYMKDIATPLSDNVRILPMIYSTCTALALVAKSVFNGFIETGNPKIWDVAAGNLIIEEAGGVVSDFKGKQLNIFNINNGYVAGAKAIHQQLLRFVG